MYAPRPSVFMRGEVESTDFPMAHPVVLETKLIPNTLSKFLPGEMTAQ